MSGKLTATPKDNLTEFLGAVREDALDRARSLLRDFPEYANVRVPGSCWTLDPSTSDCHTDTCAPIHYCAVHGRAQMAKLLLEAGANPNGPGFEGSNGDENGNSIPIALAAWEGDLDTVAVLLARGADPNGNDGAALRTAMWHHRPDKIKLLLDQGAEPNYCTAAGLGMVGRVRAFLEHDSTLANVTSDARDALPMDVAAHFGQRETAEVLVE